MCLIEQHKGITQRSTAHVGERGDLDHATLHKLIGAFAIHHVKEGIIERTHIRVDLFLEGAGQKAQVLPRLDNRARQDQAAHLMALERGDGECHSQIGFTGTGGTEAKRDGMRANGIHVALLAERLGADDATAIRQQHVIAQRRGIMLAVAQNGQTTRDVFGRKRAPGSSLTKGMLEKTRDQLNLVRIAAHGNAVTAGNHMGAHQVLECTKGAIAGAQNARGVDTLGNDKSNLRGFHEPPCVHGPSRNHRLR